MMRLDRPCGPKRFVVLALTGTLWMHAACRSLQPSPTLPVEAQQGPESTTPTGRSLNARDAEAIGRAAAADAALTPDGVVRIGWARDDVAVTVDGMAFPPAAGLGSWAAFCGMASGTMVMGDTVVFEDEISPAIDAAFAAGLEVSALHNHFLFDQPKVYFMHIGGRGDAVTLARGVKAVWDAIKAVRASRATPATGFGEPTPSSTGPIDVSEIEDIIGHEASQNGAVVKITMGREAVMHASRVGASMGLTTWAAFTGQGELSTIDGDFAMTAAEVQPVLRALRRAGIHVVALHNHMIGEGPAYYFTHFWGKGEATHLARGFRSALDAQANVRGDAP